MVLALEELNTKAQLTWHPHFDTWIFFSVILISYFYLMRRHASTSPVDGVTVSRRQVFAFCSGIAMLWIASDYPIHDIAEQYLFSVHMLQHFLITLAAPPLLIAGLPEWAIRGLFVNNKRIYAITKVAFAPLFAAVLYNAMTVVSHWPLVVNGVLQHHALHFFMHVLMFSSAFAMWMPVVNKCKDLPTMSPQFKILYLFLQSLIPTVPAAFITFAEKPVYSFYAQAPRLWGMSVIDDQQLGGAFMKIIGGGFLWAYVIGVFFRWYSKEHPANRPGGELKNDVIELPKEPAKV